MGGIKKILNKIMNYNIGLYAATTTYTYTYFCITTLSLSTVLLLFNFDFSFNLIIINVIFLHSSFICLFVCSFHRFLFIRSFITFFIHSLLFIHSLNYLNWNWNWNLWMSMENYFVGL